MPWWAKPEEKGNGHKTNETHSRKPTSPVQNTRREEDETREWTQPSAPHASLRWAQGGGRGPAAEGKGKDGHATFPHRAAERLPTRSAAGSAEPACPAAVGPGAARLRLSAAGGGLLPSGGAGAASGTAPGSCLPPPPRDKKVRGRRRETQSTRQETTATLRHVEGAIAARQPPGSRYGPLGGRWALRRRERRARASGGKLRWGGRGRGDGLSAHGPPALGVGLPAVLGLRCFQLEE